MSPDYRDNLAHIHDAGFAHLARAAAALVVAELAASGIAGGTIVELGCGSGISSRIFRDAGFDVCGFDLSPAMLRLAGRRVPDGRFTLASWTDATLPPCVAVTAIGEVLSYGTPGTCDAWPPAFERMHRALVPGGIVVFDTAGPDRGPDASDRRSFDADDWAVLVESQKNAERTQLARRITSFLRVEGDLFRRDVEEHQLVLVEPSLVESLVTNAGFDVRSFPAYGVQPLPPGLTAFVARKR